MQQRTDTYIDGKEAGGRNVFLKNPSKAVQIVYNFFSDGIKLYGNFIQFTCGTLCVCVCSITRWIRKILLFLKCMCV